MEAYQFRRIVNLHQGFNLVRNVSDWNAWPVKLIEVARYGLQVASLSLT